MKTKDSDLSEYISNHRSFPMRKLAATVLMMALTFPPSFAFADANTAADLYRDASEAYQRGDFKNAASLLEKAYGEDQNLIYKYNQILAYMGARNHTEALHVLEKHSEAMKADGRFDDIDEIKHQLETTIAEREKAEQDKIAANNTSSASQNQPDNSIAPPPTPAESSPNYLAWSIVGVGGAALISSALFASTLFVQEEYARATKYNDLLADKVPENQAALEVYTGGKAMADADNAAFKFQRIMTYTMLGTGIVLVGTGLALWYFDIPNEQSDDTIANKKADDSNPLKVRVAPYFSTDSAGASMHLNF